MTLPALLGGSPAFADGLPFARPFAPPLARVTSRLAPSYDRGILTNGPLVRELEEVVATRMGVGHVVAVANCTSGLMLALHALAPAGPVLLPSFTFSASAHAISWNGLATRFAECDPATFHLDLEDAATRLDGVGALMATHVFGAPCRPSDVERLATRVGIPVVFDAAHGFGATHEGRPLGSFGDVEVFSMSPTKPVVAGEGGLVTTNRADVAESVRLGRDYGNPGDYDTRFVGLNARMSELHAAVALCSIDEVDMHLEIRRTIAGRYLDGLADVPGIATQAVDRHDSHTWKDFTVAVDPDAFGVSRDLLVQALRADGIDTRCYFDPPVHRQQSHNQPPVDLPVTDRVASRVVSLPLYRDLDAAVVDRVVGVISSVHEHAERVAAG
ncbi:MAG: DegT/DnrJ/EryC1/StrS family aminotransferase [Actinobacteria bacterium]|nr:DegT/DnrJ/EryC1/StrS family aminotransferase [Actinomycetota bacterium]